MRLSESKLDLKNYLYFHGSRHAGKLLQIDAPTPENIFFVTADLDYAMEYAKFNTQSDARNVYVVTLNEDKLNAFDVWRDEISSSLKKKWSYDTFMLMEYGTTTFHGDPKDMLEVFIELARYYQTAKTFDFDEHKYFDKYNDYYSNDYDRYDKVRQFLRAVKVLSQRKEAAVILDAQDKTDQNYASKSGRKLRSLFCKDLLEEGYNAYSTEELVYKHRSDYCYGIFDKSALETLVLTPIDQNVAKKAIDKLARKGIDDYWYFSGDDDDKRNYSESNAVIHAFMKAYNEMKR